MSDYQLGGDSGAYRNNSEPSARLDLFNEIYNTLPDKSSPDKSSTGGTDNRTDREDGDMNLFDERFNNVSDSGMENREKEGVGVNPLFEDSYLRPENIGDKAERSETPPVPPHVEPYVDQFNIHYLAGNLQRQPESVYMPSGIEALEAQRADFRAVQRAFNRANETGSGYQEVAMMQSDYNNMYNRPGWHPGERQSGIRIGYDSYYSGRGYPQPGNFPGNYPGNCQPCQYPTRYPQYPQYPTTGRYPADVRVPLPGPVGNGDVQIWGGVVIGNNGRRPGGSNVGVEVGVVFNSDNRSHRGVQPYDRAARQALARQATRQEYEARRNAMRNR